MNISIKLQIQKRKIEYKNNENNTKAKGEISMDFTGKNIIVTGGDKLPNETVMCERLNVGRSSLREADMDLSLFLISCC